LHKLLNGTHDQLNDILQSHYEMDFIHKTSNM